MKGWLGRDGRWIVACTRRYRTKWSGGFPSPVLKKRAVRASLLVCAGASAPARSGAPVPQTVPKRKTNDS